MKRITALILTATLLVLLAATPTLAEGGTEAAARPQTAEDVAGAAAEGLPAEDASAPEAPLDPATREQLGIAQETEETGLSEWERKLADYRASLGDVLPFGTLRERLEKNNNNVKALKEQINDLSDMDVNSLNSAIGELRKLDSALSDAMLGVEGMDPALGGVLGVLLQVNRANIRSQLSTLDGQIESLRVSRQTGENSLKNGIDQIVKGTETLYIAVAAMEASLGGIERALQTLDRAVAIYEKQYELGMASLYELESIRHQRSAAVSSLESLLFQIKSSKITLEGMCGLPLTGAVRLEYLVIPDEGAVDGVDYEGELRQAMGRNVDVMNARVQEDYDDSDANEYARKAAEDTFTYNFKVVCLTVGEKWRLAEAAQETLAFQRRTFEITEKKYALGMVSEEEYLSGRNDMLQAESDLYTAQIELFGAYNDYKWARDCGIV